MSDAFSRVIIVASRRSMLSFSDDGQRMFSLCNLAFSIHEEFPRMVPRRSTRSAGTGDAMELALPDSVAIGDAAVERSARRNFPVALRLVDLPA